MGRQVKPCKAHNVTLLRKKHDRNMCTPPVPPSTGKAGQFLSSLTGTTHVIMRHLHLLAQPL